MDIRREGTIRQRRTRRIIYSLAGLLAIASVTLGVSRLKPAPPSVDKATVWVDAVKRGPMLLEVRGLGTLVPEDILVVPAPTDGRVARRLLLPGSPVEPDTVLMELTNPEQEQATLDARNGIVPGHVVRVDPSVVEGSVTVDVKLDAPLPKGARPDLSVEGTIQIENLADVVYVGRPAFGQPNSTVGIFRLGEDGKIASRVQVNLGRASVIPWKS